MDSVDNAIFDENNSILFLKLTETNDNGNSLEMTVDESTIQGNSVPASFQVDRTCIPTIDQSDQGDELKELEIQVYNQDVLEKGILDQVDKALEKEIQIRNEKERLKVRKVPPEGKEAKNNENKDEQIQNFPESFELEEETERARKIRLGEMTPFGTLLSNSSSSSNSFENYLKQQEELQQKRMKLLLTRKKNNVKKSPLKKSVLMPKKRKKKVKLGTRSSENVGDLMKRPGKLLSEKTAMEESPSGSEYVPTDSSNDEKCEVVVEIPKVQKFVKKRKRKTKDNSEEEWATDDSDWEYSDDEKRVAKRKTNSKKEMDDGEMDDYLRRLSSWERSNNREEIESNCREMADGFKMPSIIWNKLYKYQKVGVQWLWELNLQRCGGILGDEMGLGKTIQVISFLAGLSVSKLMSRHGKFRGLGPILIVCPTTVMHQWVKEFHIWWPQFRIALLHESGGYQGKRSSLVRDIVNNNGILVTSYVSAVQQITSLLNYTWHYVILDEGHKIRNPDAKVTVAVKQLHTPHRIILSGSPIQNNLKELWSLFDFIFPGKLGTLPVFMAEFSVPIVQGGYTNATKVQVATAFKCATILRDTISPYLLRRMKSDVKDHINLPSKNEQVLFCRLTDEQREYYQQYLSSGEVGRILDGRYKVFVGLITLRKICNHPHLYSGGPKLFRGDNEESIPLEERYGYWQKAGKMIVVETLLKIWKKQDHRVLLFTQSRQMLCILENFIQQQGYTYLKLDGSTGIGGRQPLITKYNENKEYFVFLSTTHVGGLGVNLTGADRVVIYDPDWNPATDTQARERAWRIGQLNQVTVYRLVTAGTIEEKIYHRQIFKQFLTNKVLKDPRQRRFFKSNDLYELFTLNETSDNTTETSALFAGTGSEIKIRPTHREKVKEIRQKISLKSEPVLKQSKGFLSQEKIEQMKKLAQQLSRQICMTANKPSSSSSNSSVLNSSSNCSEKSSIMEKSMSEIKEQTSDSVCDNVNVIKPNSTSEKVKSSVICDSDSLVIKKKKTEKSHRKHKHRRRKDVSFEGEVVPHLCKHSEYKPNVGNDVDHQKQDEYILKKLLSRSGIQTALKHDKIMEEGPSDYALVEGEAEKVAKEAVIALKESRRNYRMPFSEQPAPSASVTLRFGKKKIRPGAFAVEVDNPSTVKDKVQGTPMSSSELLSRIRERNSLLTNQDDVTATPSNDHSELLADIRNFIAFGTINENRATTREIIENFSGRLPSDKSPLFKALLYEICEFHRPPSGEGMWRLRTEFRW